MSKQRKHYEAAFKLEVGDGFVACKQFFRLTECHEGVPVHESGWLFLAQMID